MPRSAFPLVQEGASSGRADDVASPGEILFADVEVSRRSRVILTIPQLRLVERRVGLIGNNGSGKSTMLRLINGLLLPAKGQVTTAGLDTVRGRRQLPAKVGFLFQNPDHQLIFPTVIEEIAFGPRELGMPAQDARAQAVALLERHNCADWADRNVNELSGGQRQLLCILAVLASRPSILLMDEPFSSLDLPSRLTLFGQIAALPQQVVMASHDLDMLSGFDRVIWLDHGVIRADGAPAEVIPAYRSAVMSPGSEYLVTEC
ncbi:MAG: energy-coupling factor ABC transporter ATP-binding protein [Alphaproteobacteria bacterium]|nr:energy-coupling factor ABC transporter ATP-binding protein [Alphaproteobacteria bacterium]